MMYGRGKSRPVIVARKPANKAARSATEPSVKEPAAAESAEPRAGAKGNVDWQSTRRTQRRVSVSQEPERIRQVGARLLCRLYPRWEPYAGKSQVRNCAGGARQLASLPRLLPFVAVQTVRNWPKVAVGDSIFAVMHNTPIIEDVVVCFPAGSAGYEAARIHHSARRCEVTMALLQNGFQYYSLGA
jgi:hypothetical protein